MPLKKTNPKKNEIKINLDNRGVRKVVGAFAGKLNKMLKEDVRENIEFGTRKVGNAKVDYGIRMKFLDGDKSEDSEFKFIKKQDKEK